MIANFHPDAQAELNHAIDYYEKTKIYILALMHLHREPGYWSERAQKARDAFRSTATAKLPDE